MLGLKGPHRDSFLALALRPEVDPQVIALEALVKRFSKEIWLASEKPDFRDPQALRFGSLAVGINKFLSSCKGPSSAPSGPLAAFHSAVSLAGWTYKGPFALVKSDGIVLDMSKACPYRVSKAFRADLVSCNVKRSMGRLHDRLFNDETFALNDKGLVFEPLAKCARSSNKCNAALVNKFVSNGITTNLRLYNMGYDVDPACALCGEALDTVYHRLYTCIHNQRRAQINLGKELFDQAICGGEDCLLFNRGLAPMPPIDPPCDQTIVRYVNFSADTWLKPENGKVYLDGSCSDPTSSVLARAGFGICQIDGDGSLLHGIYGSLPRRLPQTSMQAEAGAVVASFELSHDAIGATDCSLIEKDFRKGIQTAAQASSPIADSWRQILHQRNPDAMADIVKVKAHRSENEVSQGEDWTDWKGNDEADKLAKLGAELHAVPVLQKKDYHALNTKIRSIIQHMVDTLSTWPKTQRGRKLQTNLQRVETAELHERHHFVNVHDRWGCIKCSKTTRQPTE